jgi:hypothetical protein
MGGGLYKWEHFSLIFLFHFSLVKGFLRLEIVVSFSSDGSSSMRYNFNFTQNSYSLSSSGDDDIIHEVSTNMDRQK